MRGEIDVAVTSAPTEGPRLVVDRSGQVLGCCAWSVDWSIGSASVGLRWSDGASSRWPEVERLVRTLARDELGLNTVYMEGPSQQAMLDLDAG